MFSGFFCFLFLVFTGTSPSKQEVHQEEDQNENDIQLVYTVGSRLKWTPKLHGRFIEAVEKLGGHNQAKPKNIMRLMNVEGLELCHIKSHLQKYRQSKQEENVPNEASSDGIPLSNLSNNQAMGGSSSMLNNRTGNVLLREPKVKEDAFNAQMETQRKAYLHRQENQRDKETIYMEMPTSTPPTMCSQTPLTSYVGSSYAPFQNVVNAQSLALNMNPQMFGVPYILPSNVINGPQIHMGVHRHDKNINHPQYMLQGDRRLMDLYNFQQYPSIHHGLESMPQTIANEQYRELRVAVRRPNNELQHLK